MTFPYHAKHFPWKQPREGSAGGVDWLLASPFDLRVAPYPYQIDTTGFVSHSAFSTGVVPTDDLIHTTGDGKLENFCRVDPTWESGLLEKGFGRLTVDMKGIQE